MDKDTEERHRNEQRGRAGKPIRGKRKLWFLVEKRNSIQEQERICCIAMVAPQREMERCSSKHSFQCRLRVGIAA